MLAAPSVEFLTVIAPFLLGQEDWNELVAALSDLTSRLLEAHVMTETNHGLMPCQRVKIDRVQKRAVHVEDRGLRHSSSSVNGQQRAESTNRRMMCSPLDAGSHPVSHRPTREDPARLAPV